MTYNYLDKYLVKIRSKGRYSFTIKKLQEEFNVSYRAIKQNLYRLKSKNEIAQVRQGFYVVIPPEYSKLGMLPPYLFIGDLMKSLNKPYYVGLLSAAALNGAAHQQPMEFFVIVQTPAPRSINNEKLKISFFSKNIWEQDDIVKKTTDAGYINVSSPELTALDLLAYTDKIGLNRATTVLQELASTMKVSALSKTAKKYSHTPVIQRLGYILDKILGEEKLAEALLKVLNDRNVVPVLLSTQKERKGETDTMWKVVKNMEIESDL
ncbi:MAG: type IV toxin-antitoxin system AbiEi family antitoxin [Bacteroidales bacterium]|jgi:predicted transcriptional regulator of viral defense system|nr:type IV toxin-antitoxin system AbiEi family antitoxin [Bacteroidales bacterium]